MTSAEHEAGEVEVGQIAPDFVARDLDDNEVSLRGLIRGRKALLLFYRGGWCPFCNKQLAAISRESQSFKDAGATIVAVSGEEVEKGKALLRKLNLPFILLSDTNFVGIDRYGVNDPNPHEQLKAIGITRLSKPAAFVIDDTGVVRYKHVGKNASDRPKNEDLLKAIASS
jgi:peroxiredoxin